MRKYLLVVGIFLLFAVSGCGKTKKVVCIKNISEENLGYQTESRVTGILKDDVVLKEDVKVIMTFDNQDYATTSYESMKSATAEIDTDLSIKANVITITELQELNESVSKDTFINAYSADGYTCE